MWRFEFSRKFIRANPVDELEYIKVMRTPFWDVYNLICDGCGMVTMVFEGIDYTYCPHCGKNHKEGENYESTETE